MADDEVFQEMTRAGRRFGHRGDSADDQLGPDPNADVLAEMRKNRRVAAKIANVMGGGRGGADISFATQRPRDPMFYWRQNNLPYDITKAEELRKIRSYCRLLYLTHPVIASAIDVYSKYPLTGMEFTCKDDALTEFYTTLFFEQLNYEEFLVDLLREYWLVGEAWPLGSFNETLGVWEDDELVNPDDVDVIRSPFLKEPRFQMRLPEIIRKIIEERSPQWEFAQLMHAYPELKNFVGHEARMPVSNILLKQIKFKADTFHPRGIPILMRGFRAIMQEEMLNAAQDAVADRLYTPLLLLKLGASATDLGTNQPWIPQDEDIADLEEAFDAALAGDFRALFYHFALQVESVFGRENMPNLDADFERLTDRILQVFGLSRSMMSGAQAGTTYASDAINRDLISQLLTTAQRLVKRFVRDRMLVVAEAQEHYDYEERGGKRYPIMEEVYEIDEETGEGRIVEQPKLLVPDLKIKAMNMADEQDLRQFYEALRSTGVPISDQTRLVNVPIDLDEEVERVIDEQVKKAVNAQEARKRTFLALRAEGLPIPDDLRTDFEPKAHEADVPAEPGAEPGPLPSVGIDDPASTVALVPTSADYAADGNGQRATVHQLPRNRMRNRPEESDDQRARMPKPASALDSSGKAEYQMPVLDDEGHITAWSLHTTEDPVEEGPSRLLSGPRHIGMRRRAGITRDTVLDGDEDVAEGE